MATSSAVMERRAQVSQLRQAGFEAYNANLEYQRRLYDEIADVAERVRAPIAPKQEFALTTEGLVSERGELLRPVIVKGLADAQRMAATNPDWQVEVLRRTIDLQEYDELETLAMMGEGSGAIVSYWLIPDAVRSGAIRLPGYNRERLKMFTRIAVPTAAGIAIKYRSYDQSHLPGVQAMDHVLDFTFDPSRTSEQIASDRRFIPEPVDDIDALDERLRQAYDATLTRDKGGEWYGGRPPLPIKEDIIAFISRQDTLLSEHMGELAKVFALAISPHERNKLMEPHRYNFAAAIDDLIHGKPVTSAGDAGDAARSEGRNLDGDCPTGKDDATESQLEKLGFKTAGNQLPRIWVVGSCRTCEREKAIDISQCSMCLDCENIHNNEGNIGLDRVMKEAAARRARAERAAAFRRKKAQIAGKMTLKQAGVVAEAAK